MIISKDLAALLVTARSAPVRRKMLFNNRHFFLGKGKEDNINRLITTFVGQRDIQSHEIQTHGPSVWPYFRDTMLVDLLYGNH